MISKFIALFIFFVCGNTFANECPVPPALNHVIPKENNVLTTTDGKYTISRNCSTCGLFAIFENGTAPNVDFTKFMMTNYSGSVVRNHKKLNCKFDLDVTETGYRISFDSYEEWYDTGGYIERFIGEIVINNGIVTSIDVSNQTSYKYFGSLFKKFKTESSFKYPSSQAP